MDNKREQIFQFQQLLARDANVEDVELRLYSMLSHLLTEYMKHPDDNSEEKRLYREEIHAYVQQLFALVGQTRDIVYGKGERILTYAMIYVWYHFYPHMALEALRNCVLPISSNQRPFGSWKDIKYFCTFCHVTKKAPKHHPLIEYAVILLNEQLRKDYVEYTGNHNLSGLSLAAKWAPREKSRRHGWLFELLAANYYPSYDFTSTKGKMEYRKLLSMLNKQLDTVQVKQCAQQWSSIDFDHVTSTTMYQQGNTFLRHKECANRYEAFVTSAPYIHGATIDLSEFARRLRETAFSKEAKEKETLAVHLLNRQWLDHLVSHGGDNRGRNVVAVLLAGATLECMLESIMMAVYIADFSMLRRRIMFVYQEEDKDTLSSTWIHYDDTLDIVSTISFVYDEWKKIWPMLSTQSRDWLGAVYQTPELFVEVVENAGMNTADTKDLRLVLFSDVSSNRMQCALAREMGRKWTSPYRMTICCCPSALFAKEETMECSSCGCFIGDSLIGCPCLLASSKPISPAEKKTLVHTMSHLDIVSGLSNATIHRMLDAWKKQGLVSSLSLQDTVWGSLERSIQRYFG